MYLPGTQRFGPQITVSRQQGLHNEPLVGVHINAPCKTDFFHCRRTDTKRTSSPQKAISDP